MLLSTVFGLTPAEAKLASMLARGLLLDQIAHNLSVSKDTARNQLHAVFAKTNTHRQSELVAVLAGI